MLSQCADDTCVGGACVSCLPSEVNNAGESALHYAVRNRDVALAECLIKHGADTMLRDDEGRKPMFMAPDKVFEKVMRDAEKKRKKILEPVLPPAKAAALADAEKARRAALVASAPAATQVSTREVAARQLVSMTAPDANTKAADPIKWNTLRGTSVGAYESDTVDVIHVFLGACLRLPFLFGPFLMRCRWRRQSAGVPREAQFLML